MPSARQTFRAEEFVCFAFEPLIVNRARSRIRRAYLARNLFAERHAVNEMWLAASLCSESTGRRVVRGQGM